VGLQFLKGKLKGKQQQSNNNDDDYSSQRAGPSSFKYNDSGDDDDLAEETYKPRNYEIEYHIYDVDKVLKKTGSKKSTQLTEDNFEEGEEDLLPKFEAHRDNGSLITLVVMLNRKSDYDGGLLSFNDYDIEAPAAAGGTSSTTGFAAEGSYNATEFAAAASYNATGFAAEGSYNVTEDGYSGGPFSRKDGEEELPFCSESLTTLDSSLESDSEGNNNTDETHKGLKRKEVPTKNALDRGDVVIFRGETLQHQVSPITRGRRVVLQLEFSELESTKWHQVLHVL